ncbi:MAG: molybdenum cofactor biosynthesis protein MoaE [Bacteriovoracaceae bacterium]
MIEVSEKEIMDEPAFEFVQDDSHGALVAFKGIVRDVNHGKKVVSVAYDAFVPLAKKTLLTIVNKEKFNSKFKIAIYTELGI